MGYQRENRISNLLLLTLALILSGPQPAQAAKCGPLAPLLDAIFPKRAFDSFLAKLRKRLAKRSDPRTKLEVLDDLKAFINDQKRAARAADEDWAGLSGFIADTLDMGHPEKSLELYAALARALDQSAHPELIERLVVEPLLRHLLSDPLTSSPASMSHIWAVWEDLASKHARPHLPEAVSLLRSQARSPRVRSLAEGLEAKLYAPVLEKPKDLDPHKARLWLTSAIESFDLK
jgi:hypothetical protein